MTSCCPRSQKLLRSPRKPTRKISKIPFKVLDAPELQDDFYLNLVDWSSLNVLSVGLGTCVYLWSACTSQVCTGHCPWGLTVTTGGAAHRGGDRATASCLFLRCPPHRHTRLSLRQGPLWMPGPWSPLLTSDAISVQSAP